MKNIKHERCLASRAAFFRASVALGLAVGLSSCVHLFITHVDYQPQLTASTPGAVNTTVAGARFRAEFIPQGTESGLAVSAMLVGGATVGEIGPYQVRLHGFGKTGSQASFRITRFVLTSPGNFVAPMQARGFTGVAAFEPLSTPGLTRASLLLGPSFRLDKDLDKTLLLEVDVEVRLRQGGTTTGTLRIPLQQTKTRRRESTFVVTEIWKDITTKETPPASPLPAPPEAP